MFKIHHRLVGGVEPYEYKEVKTGEEVQAGEALVLATGKLTKCGATVKPEYIAMGKAAKNGIAPVIRVLPTTVFAATAQAGQNTLTAGSKVTLTADGMNVTATTTDGVFVLDTPAAAAGGECVGRFV